VSAEATSSEGWELVEPSPVLSGVALAKTEGRRAESLRDLSSRALLCIHAEIRYHGYIEKENKEAEKTIKFADLIIPEKIEYKDMPGITRELQQKLIKYKPGTIAQAQLIPGMTPAAISILIFQTRVMLKDIDRKILHDQR
jgi:tRNA uridine 5-carboxymethylaminomethyl modification enzyme